MDAKFHIENIRLIESHFKLNTNFEFNKGGTASINYKIDIECQTKGKMVRVTLSVNSGGNEQPFIFSIVYEGKFVFSKTIDKDNLNKFARINCAAIIFPYLRETLADLTRRASITPFHADPINFVESYELWEKEQKKPKKITGIKKPN